MDVRKLITGFRKSVWFRVLYLLVLSLIVYVLIVLFASCLTLILVPVVMFVFPYWLRERKLRNYALNGLVVVLVAGLLAGYVIAVSLSSDPAPQNASYGTPPALLLTNGTVDPIRGPPGMYRFTVTLKVPGGGNPANYTLWVNATIVHTTEYVPVASTKMLPVDPGDLDLTNGKGYFANVSVPDDIYGFWFTVDKRVGGNDTWYGTAGTFGPITTGFGSFFSYGLASVMLVYMLPVVAFYFLILMLYWYTGRARLRREATAAVAPAETETGFMCTNCGADVPEKATACPKCGATFEEAPAPAGGPEAPKEPPKEPPVEPPEAGEGPDAKP